MEHRRPVATAILRFHRTVPLEVFESFAATVAGSAETQPGYLGWQVSVLTSDRLDWAIAVTFRDEAALDQWLDTIPPSGPALPDPAPPTPLPAGLEIVVDGSPRTPGLGLVLHRIEWGTETAFIAAQIELTELAAASPGYRGTTVLPPTSEDGRWTSLIRFRTEQRLQDWMESGTRQSALPRLREQLGGKFHVVTHQSFGSTVRIEDGVAEVTPNWKTNMVVLLVLYPTVMLLSRFVDPLIRRLGTDVWLTMFLSQVISVSLLTWVLMPAAGRALQGWLDPKKGAGRRANLGGALVVIAGYAVFLTIFGSVEYLQFWRQ
ncbi:antibiotic biosynthesis monooxygenase [Microlunatus phosphovorus]|uniref:antibiotic biosynthesis monooxygenase n=1 Tax=Microlunatus phosphovorus TaxID=29405 RepID=UPI00087095B7|nr:antibiotic biosynthesis monooxygenase [Microlunatus phosphovorus]